MNPRAWLVKLLTVAVILCAGMSTAFADYYTPWVYEDPYYYPLFRGATPGEVCDKLNAVQWHPEHENYGLSGTLELSPDTGFYWCGSDIGGWWVVTECPGGAQAEAGCESFPERLKGAWGAGEFADGGGGDGGEGGDPSCPANATSIKWECASSVTQAGFWVGLLALFFMGIRQGDRLV